MDEKHLNGSKTSSVEELFGRVLQKLRKEKCLSQEVLSFESGVHRTYVSLLERGKRCPSLKTIFQLSKVLEVEPSDLLLRVQNLDVRPPGKTDPPGVKPQ